MSLVHLDDLVLVSRRLEPLGVKFAFTGGAVVSFLLDNPTLPLPRQTTDVDAIVAVITRIQYTDFEERLRREAGFQNDTTEGAPLCRFIVEGVEVDVMPMRDPTGTFSDRWFEYALQTAAMRTLNGVSVWTVSASCFLATKLTAFKNRGLGDFLGSHDLEDIVTVVDGRGTLYDELAEEREDLRTFVGVCIAGFLNSQQFLDALPGLLPPDIASQARLSLVTERLMLIASLAKVK